MQVAIFLLLIFLQSVLRFFALACGFLVGVVGIQPGASGTVNHKTLKFILPT